MKSNETLFIDHIFRNNRGKYPNLDPSGKIAAGDFGYITTGGRFMKQGNIFDDGLVLPTDSLKKPEPGARSERMLLTAEGTKSLGVTADTGADIPGFADCSFKAHFQLSDGVNAVLILHRPVMTRIENQGNLIKLYSNGRLEQHLAIVSEVHACPSYALLLGAEKGGEALLGLKASIPPTGGTVPVDVQARWLGKTSSGEWQNGDDKEQRDVFYPLCVLVSSHPLGNVTTLRAAEHMDEFDFGYILRNLFGDDD